jgi:hypothetical protein
MSRFGLAESAANSFRIDSGTFFINQPFQLVDAAGGDNADVQFAAGLFLGVSDQQTQHFAGHANRLPSSRASLDALQAVDVEPVVRHETCSLKADAVFLSVRLILGIIPGEQA